MSVALSRRPDRDLDRASDPLAAVLSMCERARRALVEAASVVEAKEVLGAIATLEYAVKIRDMNQEAVVAASSLRIRAERRVGELLVEQNLRAGRPRKIVDGDDNLPGRIPDGITRDESSKFQKLAATPVQKFERAIEKVAQAAIENKSAVTREAVMREMDPQSIRTPSDAWKDGDRFKSACDRIADLADSAIEAIRWGHFPGPDAADIVQSGTLLSLRNAREAIGRVDGALRRKDTK